MDKDDNPHDDPASAEAQDVHLTGFHDFPLRVGEKLVFLKLLRISVRVLQSALLLFWGSLDRRVQFGKESIQTMLGYGFRHERDEKENQERKQRVEHKTGSDQLSFCKMGEIYPHSAQQPDLGQTWARHPSFTGVTSRTCFKNG